MPPLPLLQSHLPFPLPFPNPISLKLQPLEMKLYRELFVIWIAIACLLSSLRRSDGRSHFHKPKLHPRNRRSDAPQSPLPSPNAEPPTSSSNTTGNATSISPSPLISPPAESPTSICNTTGNATSTSPSPLISPPAESPSGNATSISPAPLISPPVESPPSDSDSNSNDTDTPTTEPCLVDVRSFGAVGDGATDDTQAFRSAWKSACSSDSAVLLAPSDGVFMITSTIFSGPCGPGFAFQVDGVLMPPDGPDCWPESDSPRQWLVFYKVDGMTLRGTGTIEGNGEKWWDLPCKPHRGPNGSTLPGPCDSPALIRFFMSSNLTVMELSIENSPQFHVKFDGCDGVRIEGISISSPALSPNTDGIHIENTKSVAIYNSKISNGDDCISIGTGCSDVDIENVTCGPSHGISIGSLGVHNSQACVSNINVRNAVIKNSDNGLRIKTWQGGAGSVTGISFDNVYMENVRNCIIIDQYYCLSKGCRNQTSAVYVSDVSYSDIKGTYDVRSPPIHFACSDSVPCTNITMSEVELLPFEGELVDDPFCWNAYGEQETLTIPPVSCLQDGVPQSLQETYNFGC